MKLEQGHRLIFFYFLDNYNCKICWHIKQFNLEFETVDMDGLPLYIQVHNRIKEGIESGMIMPGSAGTGSTGDRCFCRQ